ncbi:hypothetical protein EZV62_008247 [Acer yangbiense]|uniref:RING-type E3 ubiquitin transferase n=1 Tax=Acer yangbiense TaxID=1000413 RepID=A0A5C7IDM0_9ROSI|nr:hypothetical protein EZV62_008247 [Acer yangbiense]
MPMVMGSSSAITSSLVWFNVFVLFLLTIYCTATEISYHDHCSSIVQESPITAPEFATLPFPPFQNGYYDGGDTILNPNPSNYSVDNDKFLSFQTQHVFGTDHESVFKVEGSLILHFRNRNYLEQDMSRTYAGSFYSTRRSRKNAVSFNLKGFWSEYTGELCMVGTSSSYSREGKLLHLTAVLQLSGVKTSTITSLIRGTLQSLSSADDPNYFEPISILMFPQTNYQYTKNSNEFKNECSGNTNVAESSSLSLHLGRSVCSVLAYLYVNTFQLEYASDCNSSKTCNPFGDDVGFLPQLMSLNSIQCSSDGQSLRFLMEFPNSNYVGFYHSSSGYNRRGEIFVEGIYDAETGSLCMVGCRYLGLNNQTLKNDLMDCEIRVSLQFPSLNAKKDGVYIKGSISSARKKSDPLHFESVSVSSAAFYTKIERQSIWRMDMEILMVLITNTLACIFVVFQILYVKRHPGVLPFISLLMLVVLTLGHMMLLLLNFEAWFFQSQNRQTVLLGSGGWPEVFVAMLAFVLQFCLLKLSWSSRLKAFLKRQKALLIAEKKAWYVSLPLYLTGFLISELVNLGRKNKDVGITMQSSRLFNMQQHSLWGGLILDGFLFPQILLNVLRNSTEKALSPLFYIGYTLIRVVPHAYEADFYSTAWNVSIPLGCIFFAAILYFQQRFGGRCFVPRQFRELEGYEKVPAVAGEE